jgi:catechol 2,3-dioxygenase
MTTGAVAALPAALRLGPAHLAVTDLARAVRFYEDVVGLAVLERPDDARAVLGTDAPVVVLAERRNARAPGREAGLYHVALLFPTRDELAQAVRRIAEARVPIQGMSDHETHEAVYLPDADGNGLELACDRPRAAWPAHLGYAGGPRPLDLPDLMSTVDGQPTRPRAAAGLRVGHLHLHVGDLARAMRFWTEVVGFERMAEIPGQAGFVAAGSYHHHLGFNVWRGTGVPPAPPAGVVGLERWTVRLPGAADVAALRERLAGAGAAVEDADGGLVVRDPDGIAVAFTSMG